MQIQEISRRKKTRKGAFLLLFIGLLLCVAANSQVSFAQQETAPAATVETVQVDRAPLVQLYEQYLESRQQDEELKEEILEERAAARALIETEIWQFISPPSEVDKLEETTAALERQNRVIDSLEQKIRERTVDMDLKEGQQERYLLNERPIPAAYEDPETRAEYASILTDIALYEERIEVLNAILPVQKERLEKLKSQKLQEDFQSFLVIAKYLAILLVVILIQKGIQKTLISKISNLHQRYALNKLFTSAIYTVFALWILTKVFSERPNILASFAIVGAGLAVALQDVVKDVVGWLVILQGRFSVGDRISVSGITGDVIDVGVLRTTLLEVGVWKPGGNPVSQHTGKTLFVPNSLVLLNPVINYNKTSDYLKAEMRLEITFESNQKKAKTILQEILEEETSEFSKKEQQQYRRRTSQFYVGSESRGPRVYMDLAASGIEFTLRFDAPLQGRRTVITRITDQILERFGNEPDIDLAYSTMRIIPSQQTSQNMNYPA